MPTLSSERAQEILGLAPQASLEEVKSAYRALARRFHPDASGAEASAARFSAVHEAYRLLASEHGLEVKPFVFPDLGPQTVRWPDRLPPRVVDARPRSYSDRPAPEIISSEEIVRRQEGRDDFPYFPVEPDGERAAREGDSRPQSTLGQGVSAKEAAAAYERAQDVAEPTLDVRA